MAKIKNQWLELMPAKTLKGNDTTTQNSVKDLTVSQVKNMLKTITEAPIDGNQYVRKDAGWINITENTETHIWCGPVVELPGSNTVYADVELPEMVFEYNQYGRLDSVFEAEI